MECWAPQVSSRHITSGIAEGWTQAQIPSFGNEDDPRALRLRAPLGTFYCFAGHSRDVRMELAHLEPLSHLTRPRGHGFRSDAATDSGELNPRGRQDICRWRHARSHNCSDLHQTSSASHKLGRHRSERRDEQMERGCIQSLWRHDADELQSKARKSGFQQRGLLPDAQRANAFGHQPARRLERLAKSAEETPETF